jgi:hypothetical protein
MKCVLDGKFSDTTVSLIGRARLASSSPLLSSIPKYTTIVLLVLHEIMRTINVLPPILYSPCLLVEEERFMLCNKNDEVPLVREKSGYQEQAKQRLELS